MRILHVVPYLGSMFGGTTTVVRKMSSQLAMRGHDVTVATTDYRWDGGADADYQVLPFHARANLGLMIYTPDMRDWLLANAPDFDVMHLHTFRSYQNALARRVAVASGVHYVLQAHGGVLPSFGKRGLKVAFDLVYGQRILADASRAIAVSAMEIGQYVKMGIPRDKIELLPNGIDLYNRQELPSGEVFRERIGARGDERLVLFLGRVDRIKGLELLIGAFDQLARRLEGCRLVIAGPDFGYLSAAERKVAESGLDDRVVFTGELRGEEKNEALRSADVCVVPSAFDIFSMTALESMACGTPLVLTDRCGIADMVRDSALVVGYDSDALANAMLRVLEDGSLRASLAKAGREKVEREFGWPMIIDRLEDIYLTL